MTIPFVGAASSTIAAGVDVIASDPRRKLPSKDSLRVGRATTAEKPTANRNVAAHTRCQCLDPKCHRSVGGMALTCLSDAVRMVTVPFDKGTHGHSLGEMREIPMCEPCAAFHESKVAR